MSYERGSVLANCVVLASLASVATPLGCLMSGPLLDRFGRKTGLLIIALPLVIGWLLIGIKPTLMQVSDFMTTSTGVLCFRTLKCYINREI